MATRRPSPTRTLPEQPDLAALDREAAQLLQDVHAGSAPAVAEARSSGRDPGAEPFGLPDARHVLARTYGFDSWRQLSAFVQGATVQRLIEAVRAGRIEDVRALLAARPELARMSADNLQVLHHAVLAHSPEMVRILMEHGADARQGVYPFREATTAHALAQQSRDSEIVGIIEREEDRRRAPGRPAPFEAASLHHAAAALDLGEVARLLDGGADPNEESSRALTPADAAAYQAFEPDTERAISVIQLLQERGAGMTVASAVVLGDVDWLRRARETGTLTNRVENSGGLLRIAVTLDRPAVLEMLLDCGFDPDERIRFTQGDDDIAFSWGMPLQAAVSLGRYGMAEALLRRGADPNAAIYAGGDPLSAAYARGDTRMVALLEAHGGVPAAETIGEFGSVDLARRVLDGVARPRGDGDDEKTAEQMLSGAARQGRPEIVRLALDRLGWPRDDPRWFTMLEQTLRHESGPGEPGDDHPHLSGFRLLLGRCDPNVRGRPTDCQQFGLTTLHNFVARGELATEERVAFAKAILDSGARLDLRDNMLKSTPLGWACRWRRMALVELFLERGADPVERDAAPWATPLAWAAAATDRDIVARLQRAAG